MAVIAEALSVIVRVATITEKYPGGMESYRRACPNATFCTDGALARVAFMTSDDALAFIDSLMVRGLLFFTADGYAEIAMTHQDKGSLRNCDWLDFSPAGSHSCCSLRGEETRPLVVPDGWEAANMFPIRAEDFQFLRREGGLDVYSNRKDGTISFVGRPTRLSPPAPADRCSANGETLRAQFEGREAIYLEKGAIRVWVRNICPDLPRRSISAVVEEIETPGLPVGLLHSRKQASGNILRWAITGGSMTTFSSESWAMGYGGWALYFSPELVAGVMSLAADFPKTLDPSQGYRAVTDYLLRFVSEGEERAQPVFG